MQHGAKILIPVESSGDDNTDCPLYYVQAAVGQRRRELHKLWVPINIIAAKY